MRHRLATFLVCALTALLGAMCLAAPALAKGHDHTTPTTSSTTTTAHHKKDTTKAHGKKVKGKTATHHATTLHNGVSVAQATAVLNDCNSHGQLTHNYSKAEIRKALSIMSAATAQYSNCSDVLHSALAHGIKTSDINGSGGSGSSTTTIVIIIVVVLVLLAAIFGGLAVRRRRGGGGGDGGGDAPATPGASSSG